MARVNLPYYEVSVGLRGGRVEKVYLEAYMSRVVGGRLICLLASRRQPIGALRGLGLAGPEPWASPDDLLAHFISRAREVLSSGPPPPPAGGWALRRLFQELNRLFFGGMVTGPPVEPEVSREALSARLARRLCTDILGPFLAGGYTVMGSRLLRLPVNVEFPEGGVVVEREGREDKVLTYVARASPEAARLLKSAVEGVGGG